MPPLRKPLVVVPGFAASSLVDEGEEESLFFEPRKADSTGWKKKNLPKLHGPDDLATDDGVRADEVLRSLFKARADLVDVASGKLLAALLDTLRRSGYRSTNGDQVRLVPWDWRRPVDDPSTLDAVAAAIDELAERNELPPAVLAHGAGGLVVQALAAKRPKALARVADVVALGVPWAGCLEPLRFFAKQQDFPPFDKPTMQELMLRSWAAWDLLPPPPGLSPLSGTGTGEAGESPPLFQVDGEPASPLTATSWIGRGKKNEPFHRRAAEAVAGWTRRVEWPPEGGRGPRVWNLVGWGLATLTSATVESKELQLGEISHQGDGVVPAPSAAALAPGRARTLWLPLGGFTPTRHGRLWAARPFKGFLQTFLEEDDPWLEHVYAVADHEDATSDPATVRVHLVAQNEKGEVLPDARVRAPDRREPTPFQGDGRLTLSITRHRWRWTRSDVRQIRLTVLWEDRGRERSRDLTVLAGKGD